MSDNLSLLIEFACLPVGYRYSGHAVQPDAAAHLQWRSAVSPGRRELHLQHRTSTV